MDDKINAWFDENMYYSGEITSGNSKRTVFKSYLGSEYPDIIYEKYNRSISKGTKTFHYVIFTTISENREKEEDKDLLHLIWFRDEENGKEKAYKTIKDLLDTAPEKRLRYIQKNWNNKKIGYTKRRYRGHNFFLDYQEIREDESSLEGGPRSRRERFVENFFLRTFSLLK